MLGEAFQKLKSNLELNERFDEVIQQKHNAVRSVIENNLPNTNTELIGSLQRKTRIQPRPEDDFDIDILVILGEFAKWVPTGGITPQDAIRSVYYGIGQSERYSSMDPHIDEPTVTFEYKKGDVKVELVPAYIDKIGYYPDGKTPTVVGRGYWVPKSGRWELADYDYEAEHITKMNETSEDYLIPTVKMLKAIKRKFFPDMSSFYLEILASQIIPAIVIWWKREGYQADYPMLITNFFSIAKDKLQLPIKMEGSCSPYISLDFSKQGQVIQIFNELNNYLTWLTSQADNKKIEGWREIFGDSMPLS
jgi:hypothetical protein